VNKNNKVEIFTDGACSGNPGPGGWGAILRWRGNEKILQGNEAHTTNNRMEMMAVIAALEALSRPVDIVVSTDSRYVQQGITQWLSTWKQRDWQTANKQAVKNIDLWQRLDTAVSRHRTIEWVWVKAHNGHPENERADQLARDALRHSA